MKINMCSFSIDLRRSSDLLFLHRKQTAGKIHKAFLTVVTETVLHNKGVIRNFQGDGLLAFWPATSKKEVSLAVKAALTITWLINIKFFSYFNKYSELDFGIGIDLGEVFVVRAGVDKKANDNDLVFIGKSVNLAVAIAKQAKDPFHIEISEATYKKLLKTQKLGLDDRGDELDIWEEGQVNWNDQEFDTYLTSWSGFHEYRDRNL